MLARYKKASKYAIALHHLFGEEALGKIREIDKIQYLTPYPREGLIKQIKKFNLGFLKEFVDILVKRNDLSVLGYIEQELQALSDKKNGIKRMQIFSPLALTKVQKEEILSLFPAEENIILEEVRDTTLLCGFRIKYGDRVVDLSAKNELNIFKRLS